mmetsp:Transcript_21265/g.51389  ORF Transcript_21265/g.51389 Transcript_21265/m.51389 type:complete len:98 (-) Transcript_21265:117-410(-)
MHTKSSSRPSCTLFMSPSLAGGEGACEPNRRVDAVIILAVTAWLVAFDPGRLERNNGSVGTRLARSPAHGRIIHDAPPRAVADRGRAVEKAAAPRWT